MSLRSEKIMLATACAECMKSTRAPRNKTLGASGHESTSLFKNAQRRTSIDAMQLRLKGGANAANCGCRSVAAGAVFAAREMNGNQEPLLPS